MSPRDPWEKFPILVPRIAVLLSNWLALCVIDCDGVTTPFPICIVCWGYWNQLCTQGVRAFPSLVSESFLAPSFYFRPQLTFQKNKNKEDSLMKGVGCIYKNSKDWAFGDSGRKEPGWFWQAQWPEFTEMQRILVFASLHQHSKCLILGYLISPAGISEPMGSCSGAAGRQGQTAKAQ